jgi:hypothetical protein
MIDFASDQLPSIQLAPGELLQRRAARLQHELRQGLKQKALKELNARRKAKRHAERRKFPQAAPEPSCHDIESAYRESMEAGELWVEEHPNNNPRSAASILRSYHIEADRVRDEQYVSLLLHQAATEEQSSVRTASKRTERAWLIAATGDAAEGVVLQQLCYWYRVKAAKIAACLKAGSKVVPGGATREEPGDGSMPMRWWTVQTYNDLRWQTGISVDGIRRAVRRLEAKGIIQTGCWQYGSKLSLHLRISGKTAWQALQRVTNPDLTPVL